MRLLSRSEISTDEWDSRVLNGPGFRHYHLSTYLDACCKWHALVDEQLGCFWPLPVKQNPVRQVYQPLLVQQLGPLPTADHGMEWIDEAWRYLEKRFWRLNVKFHDEVKGLEGNLIPHRNLELDLGKPHEVIVNGYNQNTRSNLKKFTKVGLEVSRESVFLAEVVQRFKADKGAALGVLDEAFYGDVQRIFEAFLQRGEAETWLVRRGGELLAAAMILNTRGRLLNFFTYTSKAGRKVGAMHGLMDSIFRHHAGTANCFDFEGSDDDNLAFFYGGFGAKDKIYLQRGTQWCPPILKRIIK